MTTDPIRFFNLASWASVLFLMWWCFHKNCNNIDEREWFLCKIIASSRCPRSHNAREIFFLFFFGSFFCLGLVSVSIFRVCNLLFMDANAAEAQFSPITVSLLSGKERGAEENWHNHFGEWALLQQKSDNKEHHCHKNGGGGGSSSFLSWI